MTPKMYQPQIGDIVQYVGPHEVVDGSIGIGNGWLIPSGPLRVNFKSGIKTIDAAILNNIIKDEIT